jgi:hypothetical protein
LVQTADDITRSLRDWIKAASSKATVTVRSAADWDAGAGIALRLLSMSPMPTPRNDRRALMIRLDYFITPTLDDPLAEHRCLGELLFAALGQSDFKIMAREDCAKLRDELKLPLLPGIFISANLQREPETIVARPVRRPLVIKGDTIRPLEGVVLGPEDAPIMDALVELPALNLSVLTDDRGRFRFAGCPSSGSLKLFATKNNVRVGIDAGTTQPVTIHIPLES